MGRKAHLNDKDYFKSGIWKCPDSPTGAHHWVHMEQTEKLRNDGYFQCKYCEDVRCYPIYWSDINPLGRYGVVVES